MWTWIDSSPSVRIRTYLDRVLVRRADTKLPFHWSDEPGPQLVENWLEVRARIDAQVGRWLRRCLSLKGRAEVCAMHILPWILYRLSVLPLPKVHRLALIQSLSELLWSDQKPMIYRQVCCQRPQNGGLEMPDQESNWLAERLAYLGWSLSRDTVWGQKVRDIFPRSPTPKLMAVVSPRVPHCLPTSAERPSVNFFNPVTLLGLEKNCIGSLW